MAGEDALLAIAALLGLAGVLVWRMGARGPRLAQLVLAAALSAMLAAAFAGAETRALWAEAAGEAIAEWFGVLAGLPFEAIVPLIGLVMLANGAAMLAAALLMGGARLVLRIMRPYEPARPRAPDRAILLSVLTLANAGALGASALLSPGLTGA